MTRSYSLFRATHSRARSSHTRRALSTSVASTIGSPNSSTLSGVASSAGTEVMSVEEESEESEEEDASDFEESD